MKKLFFIFAIASTLFGCSDNPSSPQICETKKLYYEDVGKHTEYYDQYHDHWFDNACIEYFDNDPNSFCTNYNYDYYITIEECGKIYIKE